MPQQETIMYDADRPSRPPPPSVPPVLIDGIRYVQLTNPRPVGLAPGGGWLVAVDAKTGEPLWSLRVYDNQSDPADEADVQLVFFRSMKRVRGERSLEIENERGEKFRVDLATRSATPLQ
jgi:hypothetical protein